MNKFTKLAYFFLLVTIFFGVVMWSYDTFFDCSDINAPYRCILDNNLIGSFYQILAEFIGPVLLVIGPICIIVCGIIGFRRRDVNSSKMVWILAVLPIFIALAALFSFLLFLEILACGLSGGNYFGCSAVSFILNFVEGRIGSNYQVNDITPSDLDDTSKLLSEDLEPAIEELNLKIFKNNRFGFDVEFKYPAEWTEVKNLELKLGPHEFFMAWRDKSGQRKLEFFNICISHSEPNRSMQLERGFFFNSKKLNDIIIDGRSGALWQRSCLDCYDDPPHLDIPAFTATVCNTGDFCLAFSLGTAGFDKEWNADFQNLIDSIDISPVFDVLPEQKLCPGPGLGFLNSTVIKNIVSVSSMIYV